MVNKNDNYSTFWNKSKLHNDAEIAREQEEYDDALNKVKQAILEYKKTKNYMGLVAGIQTRCLVYKHLFLLSKKGIYLKLAKADIKEGLSIVKKYKLPNMLSSCYFRLGELAMLVNDYTDAIKNYQKAINNYIGTECEKGDYQYHLGEALYKNGERESGKNELFKGLRKIQENKSEVNCFLSNVWESGCYLKLANLLKDNEPDESEKYLKSAKKIIDSDQRLVIRKRQLKELEKKLK